MAILPQEPDDQLPEFAVETEPPLLHNTEIGQDLVLKAIKQLNRIKTSGPDNLRQKVIVETKTL